MSVQEMFRTHPNASGAGDDALVRCIDECFSCAATCTSCADACLAEDAVQDLVACIRLNLDCADVCEATGRVLARRTAFEPQLARLLVDACVAACRRCGEECARHSEHHEHCRICAEACDRCAQACDDVISSLG